MTPENQIRADFERLRDLAATLDPVPGHTWRAPRSELSWWAGDVLESTKSGASLFLQRESCDWHDPRQLHVEIRVFWAQQGEPATFGTHRAILWCEYGSRFAGKHRTLLPDSATFLYAQSLDELWEDLKDRLTRACDAYRQLEPEMA